MQLLFFSLVGLSIGSFVNALVWRVRHDQNFVTSRSKCTSCNKILSAVDLIPIFSYLYLKGKCRFCNKPISIQYILVEILYGILFFCSTYLFINSGLFNGDATTFGIFLFVSSVLFGISIYDIVYMEIFDPLIILSTFIIFFLDFLGIGFTNVSSAITGALTLYIFFYLQIFLPIGYFAIVNKKYRLILETMLSFILFPIWMFLRLFFAEQALNNISIFKQDQQTDSISTWIGGGDLRMAFFIGFLLGFESSIAALFVSYLVGAIFGIGLLIRGILNGKKYREVPFIPFLSIGTFSILIYGDQLINWYKSLFYI